jgi:hypothetical protein
MRVLRIAALGGLLAVVLAALSTATAIAAEPVFYECGKAEKVEGKLIGHYKTAVCSPEGYVETGGKFEFQEAQESTQKFKLKGKHPLTWTANPLGSIACSNVTGSGEYRNAKVLSDIKLTITGCKWYSYSFSNVAPGEIVTEPLEAEIGYLNPLTHKVGIDFRPESGEYLAIFHADGGEVIKMGWKGSVIGEIVTPINVYSNLLTIEFEGTSGSQKWQKLEGFPADTPDLAICKAIGHDCEFEEFLGMGISTRMEAKGNTLDLKA